MSMRSLVCRLMLGPAVVAAVVGVVFAASPAWARSVGLDVWNASDLARQEREAIELRDDLEATDAEICHRIEAKEAVVDALAAGRITLAQATARFTALNRAQPQYLEMIRDTFPGSTDDERMARNVITYVLLRAEDPAAYDRLTSRLDAELQAMLDSHAATE